MFLFVVSLEAHNSRHGAMLPLAPVCAVRVMQSVPATPLRDDSVQLSHRCFTTIRHTVSHPPMICHLSLPFETSLLASWLARSLSRTYEVALARETHACSTWLPSRPPREHCARCAADNVNPCASSRHLVTLPNTSFTNMVASLSHPLLPPPRLKLHRLALALSWTTALVLLP